MDAGSWAALFGFLTACAGLVKLLINNWFKQAEKLESFRASQTKQLIKNMESSLDQHIVEVKLLKVQLKDIDAKLLTTIHKLGDNTKGLLELDARLREYVAFSEKKEQINATVIKRISDDIVLLKTVVIKLGGIDANSAKKPGS